MLCKVRNSAYWQLRLKQGQTESSVCLSTVIHSSVVFGKIVLIFYYLFQSFRGRMICKTTTSVRVIFQLQLYFLLSPATVIQKGDKELSIIRSHKV